MEKELFRPKGIVMPQILNQTTKTMKNYIIIILTLQAFCLNVGAQEKLKGRVIDAQSQEPLAGAILKIASPAKTAITDNEGHFELSLAKGNYTLQVQYLSYAAREISITLPLQEPLVIKLSANTNDLQEVVINAGYYTVKEKLLTGSITTIKAVDIERQPVTNPLAAIQGRVAGLVISQSTGVPGAAFKVQMRGQTSLDLSLSQNNPLFIIDGAPFEQGNTPNTQLTSAANNPLEISSGGLSPLNAINPHDIESIEVLKDADATSIYGSRGANGVILITTKKGKAGKTRFSVSQSSGFNKVGRSMEMLNTQQYLVMRKEALANDGLIAGNTANQPGYAPDLTLMDTTRFTDFKQLLIGNTAQNHTTQLSLSGGNVSTQFLISARYHNATTVYPGSFRNTIGSVRFSTTHQSANQRFAITLGGMFVSDHNQLPQTDLTRYINTLPHLRLYDEQGKLSWAENGFVYNTISDTPNPLSLLNNQNTTKNNGVNGNMQLSYHILKSLTFKANLGYNLNTISETISTPSTAIDPFTNELPSAYFANAQLQSWLVEPQLAYNKQLGKGVLDVLLGNTIQEKSTERKSLYGSNYNSDLLLGSIGAAGTISGSNDESNYRYIGFFGRLNYNYQQKYILNFTLRRDGSSRFGPAKQWATFGALGIAWLFSNETFIKDRVSFISFGKLRGSYGTTGNDQIGDYKYLNLWRSASTPYNGIPAIYPRSLFNPNYNWELSKKFEAALELGFLKDRIMLITAYYQNRSGNQLINYSLPSQTGFTTVIKNLPALVQNAGIEMVLNTKNISSGAIQWNTSFNITFPKNKLLSFPGLQETSYASKYIIGKPLSVLRGLKYLGVDPQTGIYSFEDINNDGLLNTADYQLFKNTDPKFYGGIQNNITYKNVGLSFFFQFTKQIGLSYISQISNKAPGNIFNQPRLVLQRWQKPGDKADIQKFTPTSGNLTSAAVSYLRQSNGLYSDASFIKLRNVALSYNLGGNHLKRLGLSNARIGLEGQNLLTITNYEGADPETQNFYTLPPLRTFVATIQLNF